MFNNKFLFILIGDLLLSKLMMGNLLYKIDELYRDVMNKKVPIVSFRKIGN
ncbi:hypothetical protein bcere0001_27210 [Bacillus cereus m1293]|nr:hypothetical protein bcere0001_27210 [Bacillus cereus m1293]